MLGYHIYSVANPTHNVQCLKKVQHISHVNHSDTSDDCEWKMAWRAQASVWLDHQTPPTPKSFIVYSLVNVFLH